MKLFRQNYAAAWLIGVVATLAGCGGEDGPVWSPFAGRSYSRETVQMIKVHVAAVKVPIGATSESRALWGLLRRQVMAFDEEISLSQNGLRIAVGSRDDWDRLDDVLVDMSGRQHTPITVAGPPGRPVPVVVREHATSQTVFLVHADDTISGMDYPAGRYIFSLLCEVDPDGQTLTVTGLPLVESARRRPMIVTEQGSAAMVRRGTTYNIYPMMFQVRMNKGDFIVIGATEEASRETSLGRCFLVSDRNGVPVETVLIITPEVFDAKIK